MREEEGEPRHAYDHGGTAARTLTLHAPQDAHRTGIGSAAFHDSAVQETEGLGGGVGAVGTAESGRCLTSAVHR
ncbi:hypothetical protein GCM10010272_38790 [Streptomyces lateritius]|nr:hypothetical protein GCM10010272_38790 [Streptomyces lateritius]